MKRLAAMALGVLAVGGCVKRVAPLPAESVLTVGSHRVTWRPWSQAEDLCAFQPAAFTEEQRAMSMLLADWLGQTSAPADGAWDEEHLGLLEQGVRALPPALEAQAASLEKARTCGYGGLEPARELNAQGRRRVEEGPALVEQIRFRLALAKWKEARPAAQQAAKDERCGTKRKPPAPLLFFAAEDETARLEWLFCDGSKVVASPGNPPAWEPNPTAKKPKKEPDPKAWLDVAGKFPAENVSRAPKPPRKKVERNLLDPEPGEGDL